MRADRVLAGGRGFVAQSSDGGESWQQTRLAEFPGGSGLQVNAIAIDPREPDTILAGTLEGMFRSNDGGATWPPSNSGLTSLPVRELLFDSES